jgi:hypothetical protein
MKIEVIEFKSQHSRFAVVNSDGDAELGNWMIALSWWKAHAEKIAAAYAEEEKIMSMVSRDDMPVDMWKIYRDEDGVKEAITTYWPMIVAADPVIQQALRQIELAEIAIDAIMSTKEP